MVKSLLLGSAAGLVAVAGAQAADLPVKAKPVEYVKVCSLYGAGFYYMPGTDICLKLGGFVRYQATFHPGNSVSFGPFFGTGLHNDRLTSTDMQQRVRTVATIDTRQQTAYGTLRTYMLLGWTHDTNAPGSPSAPSVYFNRAFIQVAGFTLGKAVSFFDIYPNASFAYNAGLMYVPDTGDGGQIVATYTYQFGNGFSASLGIEQARTASVVFTGAAGAYSAALTGAPTFNHLGGVAANISGVPDVVGNLRVDQAWGSVLAAFALHDISGGYYGTTIASGNPGNAWGWAATAGGIFNLPMIAPGDRFSFQVVYTEGAVRYAALNHPTSSFGYYDRGTVGFGYFEDGVYAVGGNVQATTAWSAAAAFEHLWTPALRSSVYGSYLAVSHNASATAQICGNGGIWAAGPGVCNPDFSSWVVGTRTQWEPVKGWIMGVDVIYLNLKSATTASGTVAASGAYPTTPIANQSAWTVTFRTQRDYHP
jgi:hypothetical protein